MAPQVDDDAGTLLGDLLESELQLRAAVAPPRAEDVTGEALAVDAHEDVLASGDVPGDEREMVLAVDERQVGVPGELAVGGRDPSRRDALDELLAVPSVADEIGDRDDHEAVALGEGL
jgi:hypothetical protein